MLLLRAALALRAALTLPSFTTAALATLLIATAAAAPLVTTTAVAAWRFHRRLFLPGRLLRTRADAEQAHQLGPDAFASAGRLHHNLYRLLDDDRCRRGRQNLLDRWFGEHALHGDVALAEFFLRLGVEVLHELIAGIAIADRKSTRLNSSH